ncbi:MAG: MotA/TolQ/ExbB proton channel family protein [Saprospiraceae bacterium]|uniref:MotA/TolQ/ExbB proton channel family protein n=1 Tax=Candidatus Opimibacter skivensis TaxID=2982028 RepID=A0A9D7SV72_9BACT|nr:MotA/TolQ/ExbB proton channel family protein [Candidatus Opimibacter skivensis]
MIGFFLQAATTAVDSTAVAPGSSLRMIDILFKGGPVMIPLIILSLISIAFIISKYIFIRERSKIDTNLVNTVLDKISLGQFDSASLLCDQSNGSLGNVIKAGVSQIGKPIEYIEKALEVQSNIELGEMESKMGYISMVSGIAPRLGFIGTILGVILIFYNISQTADISIGTISGGLYQKMISSATGLVVGVVAFMGYNFLLTKIDNFSLHLQKEVLEFIKGLQKPVR